MSAITLYQVEYGRGGGRSPYFISAKARDDYFSSITKSLEVATPNSNVNINIGRDYNVDIVVNVDVNNVLEYNFAVVDYKGKKYYAYIVDAWHISVGKAGLKCVRDVMFECIDWSLSLRDWLITGESVSETYPIFPQKNNFISMPDFRTTKNIEYFNPKMFIKPSAFSTVMEMDACVNFLFLYLATDDAPHAFINGLASQFTIGVIPLINDNIKTKIMARFLVYAPDEPYGITTSSGDFYTDKLGDVLDALSPYIVHAEVVQLPSRRGGTPGEMWMPPFLYSNSQLNVQKSPTSPIIYRMACIQSTHTTTSNGEQIPANNPQYVRIGGYSHTITADTLQGVMTEYELDVFNSDNAFFWAGWRYASQGFNSLMSVDIEYTLYPDVGGGYVSMKITPTNNSLDTGEVLRAIAINGDLSIKIDQETTFYAENKYYDALTKLAKTQKIVGAEIGMLSDWGSAGISLNFKHKSTAASQAFGGTLNFLKSVVDAQFDEERRNIEAENQKAKPDSSRAGDNALLNCNMFNGYMLRLVKYTPYALDVAQYEARGQVYGFNVARYAERVDIGGQRLYEYFIRATARTSDTNALNNQEYDRIMSQLRQGILFDIYKE